MARDSVRVFEVGLRDGLQNEPRLVSIKNKIWLATALVQTGIRDLELGAFVRPDRVPQMADTDEFYRKIASNEVDLGSAAAWCLVPNRKGLYRALRVGATHLAVFTAATESFVKRNIGMTRNESLREFKLVINEGREILGHRLHVRGYVSTAFGCPFEGRVRSSQALKMIDHLMDLGVDQVSVGDTIGVATPADVTNIIKPALKNHGVEKIAVHFHDTRGTALANTLRALDLGARTVDSSVGGLGGCPFAPGASGNLATEDLVYMLNGIGMRTGIQLDLLCKLSLEFSKRIKRNVTSRYLQAFAARQR